MLMAYPQVHKVTLYFSWYTAARSESTETQNHPPITFTWSCGYLLTSAYNSLLLVIFALYLC